MELVCNNCGADIEAKNVNIATDMAKCESCNSLMRASELAEKVELKELLQTPAGSKIQLTQGFNDSIEIFVPAGGVNANVIGTLVFTIFWLGFISIWTTFASIGGGVFALFSIPFWVIGFFMLYNVVKRITCTQKIVLNKREVQLHNAMLFSKTQVTIPNSNIEDIRMVNLLEKASPLSAVKSLKYAKMGQNTRIDIPTIIVKDGKKHHVFDFLSETEQYWGTRLLKQVVLGPGKKKQTSF